MFRRTKTKVKQELAKNGTTITIRKSSGQKRTLETAGERTTHSEQFA